MARRRAGALYDLVARQRELIEELARHQVLLAVADLLAQPAYHLERIA
jgi:hypothetical protein